MVIDKKVWYIDPRSGKIDRNFYYDPDTSILRAIEVASYRGIWVRVYSQEPKQNRKYYARVYPDGTILDSPTALYEEEKKDLEELKKKFKSAEPKKIKEVQKILQKIGEDIW